MTKIKSRPGGEKRRYRVVSFFYYMGRGIISPESRPDKLNMYSINTKEYQYNTTERANKATKEVKVSHKNIQLIQKKGEKR